MFHVVLRMTRAYSDNNVAQCSVISGGRLGVWTGHTCFVQQEGVLGKNKTVCTCSRIHQSRAPLSAAGDRESGYSDAKRSLLCLQSLFMQLFLAALTIRQAQGA